LSEFLTFIELGCDHILDWKGYDHILFLLTLVAPFTFRQWRSILILVTAFTLGHAITLFIIGSGYVIVSTDWVEIAIACTIFISALYLLVKREFKLNAGIYGLTFIFGLIHGLGFASYLKAIMGSGSILTPLLGFNFGVELGQLIFVAAVCLLQYLIEYLGLFHKGAWIKIISAVALVLSSQMILERIS